MKELFLGEIKQYIFWLVKSIPGYIGHKIRNIIYAIFIGKVGENVSFGKDIDFDSFQSIEIGNNSSFGDFCFLATSGGGYIKIGNDVSFNRGVHINASIGGKIIIDNFCLIGPNVVFRTANHKFDSLILPIRKQGHKFSDIHLCEDVWIGANVVILPGITVGRSSVVAAGSVVTKDLPDYSLAAGIPAKVIKKRIN